MSIFQGQTLPGIGNNQALTASARTVFLMDVNTGDFWPGGKLLEGFATRDPGNSAVSTSEIRPGLLLGKIANDGTAGGGGTAVTVGLLGASVIGELQGAITNATTQTSITLTLAAAAEVVRRVGSSGTLVITGSPTAGGTCVSNNIAFSAVNTGTGVVTVTAPAVAYVAGSWIGATDGTAVPTTLFAGDIYPLKVTDQNGTNLVTTVRRIPVTTKPLDTTMIINYPTAANTGIIAYLKAKLRIPVPGTVFSDDF